MRGSFRLPVLLALAPAAVGAICLVSVLVGPRPPTRPPQTSAPLDRPARPAPSEPPTRLEAPSNTASIHATSEGAETVSPSETAAPDAVIPDAVISDPVIPDAEVADAPRPPEKVTIRNMEWRDADLQDVLDYVQRETGLEFEISAGARKVIENARVTFKADEVKASILLGTVLVPHALTYSVHGKKLLIFGDRDD
ncbi:MAG: hypothetical protein ACC662_06970 [Planctomycetota bacterium]